MDAGKRTISDIFNGSHALEIPFFQRSYVWGEDEWERLLEDINHICRSGESYFIGSVILKQQLTTTSSSCGDVRTVIDGQQRLTTLSILLKALSVKTEKMAPFNKRFRLDDDTPVLKHNHNDIAAYNAIMDLTAPAEIKGQDNISRAYNYFYNALDPNVVTFEMVTSKMLFVVVDLSPDEDEQQIFDAINSLGVKLTTAELLKNYFFRRDDLQAYNTYWKDVFERDEDTKAYWDQEVTAGRFRRSSIDLFFYAYLQIKMQDPALAVRVEDKLAFSKVDKLFESYKKFIERYCGGDKDSLRQEIHDYAALFRKTFDQDAASRELPAQPGLERLNLIIFQLETTTLVPYVLFVERSVPDQAEKDELYGLIETYIMRRLVTKYTTKNYNQMFTERLISNRVVTKTALLDYWNTQAGRINAMPTDQEVQEAFDSYILTNKQAAGVLYLIESRIRDRQRYATQLLGFTSYSLEHVMPKKWINQWPVPASQALIDERNRKLLTLGNLTIITQALNTSIRDADWATKKAGRGPDKGGLNQYAAGIETFSPYLSRSVWDEAAIQERAEDLYQQAIKVWSI